MDEIVLTLPEEEGFHNVAHLVLGGLAVRLNLTFENLEDVQVALEGLLARADGEITVAVRLDVDGLGLNVGPFEGERLRREFADERAEVGLRRVLETVADRVELIDRDDGCWVDLRKRVERVERVE